MSPAESDEEPFDFKPFFDMIVGVLFVLLILIAAQMFFARHEVEVDRASEARTAASAADALHAAETKALLDRIATELTVRGFQPVVTYDRRLVSADLPASSETEAAATLAAALMKTAACAAPDTAGHPGCPAYSTLRLERLSLELGTASSVAEAEADAVRRALQFSAAMVGAHPELLRMRATSGGFVLPPSGAVGVARPAGAGAAGAPHIAITLELSRRR
jgi:hypothetical protein